ncbi:hypothetical protein ACOMHN_003590 [Nucella lapillus]
MDLVEAFPTMGVEKGTHRHCPVTGTVQSRNGCTDCPSSLLTTLFWSPETSQHIARNSLSSDVMASMLSMTSAGQAGAGQPAARGDLPSRRLLPSTRGPRHGNVGTTSVKLGC